MTEKELLNYLECRVTQAGSQKDAAKALDVSQAYLCQVLNGRAAPGKSILKALGLRKRVVYERVRA